MGSNIDLRKYQDSDAIVDASLIEAPAGISCTSNGWIQVVVNYSAYIDPNPPNSPLKTVFVRCSRPR